MASSSVFRLSFVAAMHCVVFLQFGCPLGEGIESLVTARDLPLKTTLAVDRLAIEDRESRKLDQYWIGYTDFRTNLKGGRHPNQATMRACIIKADGSEQRILAEELVKDANTWTQFAGWSPDGQMAILYRGSNTPDNAALEEKERSFRFRDRTNDCFLFELATGKATNLSAVERVSNYNGNLFFWPGNPKKLGFDALIDGNSHPFSMDRDGRNKKDLTGDSKEFSYGFHVSPDGKRIAYNKNYQIYVAAADGTDARHFKTGNSFNFQPQWSPDGEWMLFVSGEHYDCHPHVVRANGEGLRKVGNRKGYKGVVEFLDVSDFHGGSSDLPAWSPDGKWIYFTSKQGESVELMRTTLGGKEQQLTKSKAGTLSYHPVVSPDGKWLLFGAKRDGVRNLYIMPSEGGEASVVTNMPAGSAAMWPHWRPLQKR